MLWNEKSPFPSQLWWKYVKCADSIDPLTHNSYYNTNPRNVVGNNSYYNTNPRNVVGNNSYYNTNPRSVVSNNSHYKYKSEDKFPQQYRSCSMKRKLKVQCFYYCWHRTVTPFFLVGFNIWQTTTNTLTNAFTIVNRSL